MESQCLPSPHIIMSRLVGVMVTLAWNWIWFHRARSSSRLTSICRHAKARSVEFWRLAVMLNGPERQLTVSNLRQGGDGIFFKHNSLPYVISNRVHYPPCSVTVEEIALNTAVILTLILLQDIKGFTLSEFFLWGFVGLDHGAVYKHRQYATRFVSISKDPTQTGIVVEFGRVPLNFNLNLISWINCHEWKIGQAV
jgi:hypothetical protein